MRRWLTPFLALALAAPAGAQQWQVAREQFAFAGRQITVHVDAEVEGTLRIIRGPSGMVRVSGRSDTGFTAAGLSADEHLTLSAVGTGPVDYLLSVPERVWVSVRLPDRPGGESMASHQRSATFQWGPTGQQYGQPVPDWVPEPTPGLGPAATYTVAAGDLAPRIIALPDLRHVRSVTVRLEGATFRVAATRPLSVTSGDPRRMVILPGGPPLELEIVVPAGTADFTLEAEGSPALRVSRGALHVLCEPSTRQWLPGNRSWVTFTPVQGTLECS
jgi:hypothetical protein